MRRRQADALLFAKKRIQESPLLPYVRDLILFGSCARNEEKYSSDVDLLLVLDPAVRELDRYSYHMHLLRGIISSDELHDAEADLKIVIGSDWETDPSLFFTFVRKEGISVWP